MGNFPNMGGGMTASNSPEEYILLGVSAIILLIGIVVAAKFKR